MIRETLRRPLILGEHEDPTWHAYRAEMRTLVATRVRLAWGLFLAFLGGACALGWIYYPEHDYAILVMYGAALFVGLANVRLVRARTESAVVLTGLATLTLGLVLCAYFSHVHGLAELCVMGLMIFMTGLAFVLPWGAVGQGIVSGGLIIGYFLALRGGIVPALPLSYGIIALMMAAALATLGAHLMDSYRFDAYRHAIACERANDAKSEFLATVSHELRTPLTVILGFTDLMLDEVFTRASERLDALRRVRLHSLQLLDLIQSMLDLNRLESGGTGLHIERFPIGALFDNLRDNLPAGWCKEGVQLKWELHDGQTILCSDRVKVEMILRNLIHNALKYTENGTVTVSAALDPHPDRVQLEVTDTGAGIPPDDLAVIFDMFRQANSQPPRGGGVGLGLYIVKRLTEVLGGEVTVSSKLDAGTRFTVWLPLEARVSAESLGPDTRRSAPR